MASEVLQSIVALFCVSHCQALVIDGLDFSQPFCAGTFWELSTELRIHTQFKLHLKFVHVRCTFFYVGRSTVAFLSTKDYHHPWWWWWCSAESVLFLTSGVINCDLKMLLVEMPMHANMIERFCTRHLVITDIPESKIRKMFCEFSKVL